jgi:DNA polymerase-3 subunit delta
MNYLEFLQHLKSKKFYPSYFLCGTEEFLIEDAMNRLIAEIVDPGTRDFNFDVFYGDQTDGGKIIETANAYPMLSQFRMVVVKDALKLPPISLEALAKYLERPSATTKLVLLNTKLDSRNKILAKIKSITCFVDIKPLYDRQIPQWIRSYLQEKGCDIEPEAALLLLALVGNSLRAISNELEKIMINLNGKKRISAEDVQKFVALSRNFSVFDLTDAIGYKDLGRALGMLNQMLESGESATGILAMIARHFVNLMKLKSAQSQKKSQEEIAALTGIPPYFLEKSLKMAEKYSLPQIKRTFERLLETDLALKTSQQPEQIALQTLLVQVINH